jgi:hypothetical protein
MYTTLGSHKVGFNVNWRLVSDRPMHACVIVELLDPVDDIVRKFTRSEKRPTSGKVSDDVGRQVAVIMRLAGRCQTPKGLIGNWRWDFRASKDVIAE